MAHNIDLNPVSAVTTGAVGPPGQRVFYLQARRGPTTTITIETEKEQVRALALGIHQFLEELTQRFPDRADFDAVDQRDLVLQPPFEPEFKVGQLGLGYDSDQDLVVIVAQALQIEEQTEDDAITARFWITRSQAKAMADNALEIVAQGRPTCALCGRPINSDGHFCPKRNGHATDLIVQ